MLNESVAVAEDTLKVLTGVEMNGEVNVSDDVLLDNVRSAIRRPYPQIRQQAPNADCIALVGSGPSLADTEGELVDAIRNGAKLVTVNGAYQWCLDHNLHPKSQIVMDARPSNARFLHPAVPQCNYMLASQCAPETWDAVEGRPNVWMFHAAISSTGPLKALLDAHYLGKWFGVGGGVTVASRAITMLRMLGYLRFECFGLDSCWMGETHHAFDQPENQHDTRVHITVHKGHPTLERTFVCSPWHVKQLEDFLQVIRVNGHHFLLNFHGDGLLSYALRSCADLDTITTS